MFHLWNDCSISREESFLCQFLLITCARLSLKRSPATATATTLWALVLTFPPLFLKCKFGISPLNFKAGKCYCTPRVLYALSCFLVRKSQEIVHACTCTDEPLQEISGDELLWEINCWATNSICPPLYCLAYTGFTQSPYKIH